MRLTFKRVKSSCGTTVQVYPIDAKTGEEIEDVKACSVDSICDGVSTMTVTIKIGRDEEKNADNNT